MMILEILVRKAESIFFKSKFQSPQTETGKLLCNLPVNILKR